MYEITYRVDNESKVHQALIDSASPEIATEALINGYGLVKIEIIACLIAPKDMPYIL